MLSRQHRLRSNGAFRTVYTRGRSWVHPLLVLHILPRPGGEKRIGISASRRVGGAVVRNRVRRRLRAICRDWEPRIQAGYDLVISVRRAAAEAEFRTLHTVLGGLLGRAGVLAVGESAVVPAQPLGAARVQTGEEMGHELGTGETAA